MDDATSKPFTQPSFLAEAKPCPICGDTVDDINARAEAALRNRALTLSSAVTILMLTSYIWFEYVGKTFAMPEIVWCIILAPWFGAGGGKLADLLRPKK